jgi:hypothetical protein
MYFTQITKPLLKAKFKMLKIIIVFHPLVKVLFHQKVTTYSSPISWRIPANCSAGMCFTPSLGRSSGSQKKQKHNAIIAKLLAFFEQIMRLLF